MDSYLSSKIDAWSNTSIRDQKTKDFINSIINIIIWFKIKILLNLV